MINEKRVKKLIPYVEKILGRETDLVECTNLINEFCNEKDTDNMILEQLILSKKYKGVK